MQFGIVRSTLVLTIILFAATRSYAAPLVLDLKVSAGVYNGANPATNNQPVTLWDDQSTANNDATVPGGKTSPVYHSNYNGTGEAAIRYTNSGDLLALSTPLISGTTDFAIFARAYVQNDGVEHQIVTNWHQFNNTSGIQFRFSGKKLGVYVGYTGGIVQTGSLEGFASQFRDIGMTRSGNVYSVFIDLNNDGDFSDTNETVSQAQGLASDAIGGNHVLDVGSAYYGLSPENALSSIQVFVPEPASLGVCAVTMLTLLARRRHVR